MLLQLDISQQFMYSFLLCAEANLIAFVGGTLENFQLQIVHFMVM